MKLDPVHRSLVAVDIEGYSRRRNQGHLYLRDALRQILADAFDSVRVEIIPAEQQDQGDGFLTLVRPDVSKVVLVDSFIRELENGLRQFNHYQKDDAKLRLRVALHSGEVHLDGGGFPGEATVTVMRLINAEKLRSVLATSSKDIAVIVSDGLYRDVVLHGYSGIVPDEYGRVEVSVKDFNELAWLRVPGFRAVEILTDSAVDKSSERSRDINRRTSDGNLTNDSGMFGNAHFGGPTSFGGYAAGRDINLNKPGWPT